MNPQKTRIVRRSKSDVQNVMGTDESTDTPVMNVMGLDDRLPNSVKAFSFLFPII